MCGGVFNNSYRARRSRLLLIWWAKTCWTESSSKTGREELRKNNFQIKPENNFQSGKELLGFRKGRNKSINKWILMTWLSNSFLTFWTFQCKSKIGISQFLSIFLNCFGVEANYSLSESVKTQCRANILQLRSHVTAARLQAGLD